MKTPTLFSYALFLSIVFSTSCGPISEPKDGVEEHVEASTPLEVSVKSGEAGLDERTADLEHTSSETRVERSSEATLDKSDDKVESKIDREAEATLKAASDDDKSAEIAKVDGKMADFNDAAEEISSERSITNDAGLKNNDGLNMRSFNKDTINEKSVDDQMYNSRETYDTPAILDNKGRTADNSEDNLEIQAKSDLEALNSDAFGSRRSYTGSPSPSTFVTSARSGQIFEDLPLPLPNPNPAMFNKIPNQEPVQPNDFFKSTVTSSTEYKSHGLDPYFDPASSAESRTNPLEQFNSNPFANSYPYVFQPTTTTSSPAEISRYQDLGLLPKLVQPLDNFNRPIPARFLGENLKPLPPLPLKPYEQNLQLPVFRPFNNRFNQLPTQPPRYYKKCTYCP